MVFNGSDSINNVILDLDGLQLLPSSIALNAAELEFAGESGREFLLKEALNKLDQKPDSILIDCPPNLDKLTTFNNHYSPRMTSLDD